MSPFCRQCLGIARAGESRCPLDNEFYLRRDCPGCEREVFPRELYCAHCAMPLEGASETVLLPAQGPRLAAIAGLLLDLVGVMLAITAQFWSLPTVWALGFGLLLGLLYRALSRAGGRQSFGQAVFHQLTVSRDAGPVGCTEAFRRTAGELLWLPWSLLGGEGVLTGLDDFSDSYEVALA